MREEGRFPKELGRPPSSGFRAKARGWGPRRHSADLDPPPTGEGAPWSVGATCASELRGGCRSTKRSVLGRPEFQV